jgi:hypothetical protein
MSISLILRGSVPLIDRYSGLTNYLTVNTISYKSTVDDFNHTGMGKEHPFDADDHIQYIVSKQ